MKNSMARVLIVSMVIVVSIGWWVPNVAQAQSPQTKNTVTVLVEGYAKPVEGREFMPWVTDDGARRVAGTVVLVQGESVTLVSDPGMVTDRAVILDALKKEGVSPDAVTHVFVSHHHLDHTVNIALFPNAELVDFWGLYKGDLWQDHEDGYEIASGIRVLRTPGHTEEDASLVVETTQGTYVLTHLWALGEITLGEDPLAANQEALVANKKKIAQIADWIIPGHGPAVKNPHKAQE